MRRFAGLVALWCLFAPRGVAAQAPGRISVYTHSRDSAAGFKDDRLDVFRREFGKYAASFMEVAYETESAQVRLLFLGPGELSVALGPDGETEHHLFTPDEKADRTWVVLRVETFSKEFLPWCTTPIEADSSLGPDSHHPIISLSGIPSAVMVFRILHPILASTLCAANPLARIAEPTIAL